MIYIAEQMKIDYFYEFKLVLKRRFAQKLEYCDMWNDEWNCLVEDN